MCTWQYIYIYIYIYIYKCCWDTINFARWSHWRETDIYKAPFNVSTLSLNLYTFYHRYWTLYIYRYKKLDEKNDIYKIYIYDIYIYIYIYIYIWVYMCVCVCVCLCVCLSVCVDRMMCIYKWAYERFLKKIQFVNPYWLHSREENWTFLKISISSINSTIVIKYFRIWK